MPKGAAAPTGTRAGPWVVGQQRAARSGDTHMTNTLTKNAPKRPSKNVLLADLLIRESGATLDEMIATTGWLPHTTRAAITGLKKTGYAISSDKVDSVRTYRAVAPE